MFIFHCFLLLDALSPFGFRIALPVFSILRNSEEAFQTIIKKRYKQSSVVITNQLQVSEVTPTFKSEVTTLNKAL